MNPYLTERTLLPTPLANEMICFMGISNVDLLDRIEQSGLLSDPNTYAARKLEFDSINFLAFRNGKDSIRIFLSREWLNDVEVMRPESISWQGDNQGG